MFAGDVVTSVIYFFSFLRGFQNPQNDTDAMKQK
jgi:hypothetical protein